MPKVESRSRKAQLTAGFSCFWTRQTLSVGEHGRYAGGHCNHPSTRKLLRNQLPNVASALHWSVIGCQLSVASYERAQLDVEVGALG